MVEIGYIANLTAKKKWILDPVMEKIIHQSNEEKMYIINLRVKKTEIIHPMVEKMQIMNLTV